MNLTWNPWKPHGTTKMPPKTPCNCHDPVVFGHITCKHGETQPDPGKPLTYDATQAYIATEQLVANIDRARTQLDRMMSYLSESCGNTPGLPTDLRQYLQAQYNTGPRQQSHWVMGHEWYNEIRHLWADRVAYQPTTNTKPYLYGLPIEIRNHGGPPHLEPDTR